MERWPATGFEIIQALFGTPLVMLVLVLMWANIATGIGVSLYRGVFELGEIATFLRSRAVPYLLGGASVKLVVWAASGRYGIDPTWSDAVWLFVILALLGKIIENLREMGMPLPDIAGSSHSDSPSPVLPRRVPPHTARTTSGRHYRESAVDDSVRHAGK